MKKLLLVTVLIISISAVRSQQIFVEAGKTISSFDYTNSQGNKLANLQSTNQTFMSLGYRMNVFTKNLYLDINGNYNSYGAKGSDVSLDNYFEWNLNYIGIGAGFDYEVYKPGDFIFYLKVLASAEFMIQGTQTINDQVYNLSGEEDFNSPMYFLRGGIGVQYAVTKRVAVFTEYMYGRGNTFKDVQGDLKINANNFGFGLLINVSKNQQTEQDIERAQIAKLEQELVESSFKIEQLEDSVLLAEQEILEKDEEILEKEEEMESLKVAISKALQPYNNGGMSIYERDGNIYVTLENDMLFKSGSWKIGPEGEKAVNALGDVLAENSNVTVLIEGHTDNEPYKARGNILNNWDLSTKRATTIVEILRKNEYIDPKNLTAAGRGEYDPIADNSTKEGRKKNRRIEVIITPNIEEVIKLIEN